ncbi:MAG TPA: amidohydrolase family protein [Syntrophales bacterium]|nr:amidohydrolase family protein [Syntrophales bacterium]
MRGFPEKIIDFHVHLFPDRLFDAIWNYFATIYESDILHQLYYKESIDYLHEKGVEYIAYSNYAHKQGVAKGLNEWNIKVLKDYPELFCFAAYHPDDDDSLAMARFFLDHPRILGFKLQLLVQKFAPHDERLFPLYEMVIERGKRILFHVGTGPIGNDFVGIDNFRKLLARYPDLPANVAHMGGLEYGEFIRLLDHYPNIYLDTTWAFLPRSGFMFDQKAELLETHKDRIVYGSDFPNLIHPREEEIDCLLALNLSQDFYAKVFRENGISLLGNQVH